MAVRRKGNTTARLVGVGWEMLPTGEKELLLRWQGLHDDLVATGLQYNAEGQRVSIDQTSGPWKTMTVRLPNAQNGGETAVDIWETDTELAQVDIRNHPNIIALAADVTELNSWYKQAKNADNESSLPSDADFLTLFNLVALGVEAYEEDRIVLRHRQMLPNIFIGQITLDPVPNFYSTAALVSTFFVPNDISSELPTDGGATAPTDFQWGWKQRGRTSVVNRGEGRREMAQSWTFAAWSTILYEYVTV